MADTLTQTQKRKPTEAKADKPTGAKPFPTLFDYPEFQAAVEKLLALRAKKGDLEQKLAACRKEFQTGGVEANARAMLGGEELPATRARSARVGSGG